mgnify:CR=1 FL=1
MSKYDVILDVYENQSISKAAQKTQLHTVSCQPDYPQL